MSTREPIHFWFDFNSPFGYLASLRLAAAQRARTRQAVCTRRAVFGSPFVIVDDELFFGVDKFELLDEWLTRGGW